MPVHERSSSRCRRTRATLHADNYSDTYCITHCGTRISLMRVERPTLAVHAQSIPPWQQVMSAVRFAELTHGVQASTATMRKQNQAVLDSLALRLAVLDCPQKAAQH